MAHWSPLTDIADPEGLRSRELAALAQVWTEQRAELEGPELEEFQQRLLREWAIETGVLERLYDLDRGVTTMLVERGIEGSLIPSDATDKDPSTVVAMILDQKEAVEGLFAFVKGGRRLSVSYVKELHAVLTRHQATTTVMDRSGNVFETALIRGDWKKLPNNPTRRNGTVHEYCPPEHVAAEMDRLVELHLRHEEQGVAPEVQSAWLHHRFTQVHPFQDGNGRVARCLASLVTIKAGLFPVTVLRDDRLRYIRALEEADAGELRPLVELFVALQRRALTSAIGIARDVARPSGIGQAIAAARRKLEQRAARQREEWRAAEETADHLRRVATERLEAVAAELRREVGAVQPRSEFFVDTEPVGGERTHYFRSQVVQSARALGYSADLGGYRAWTRLVLRTDARAEILLSFHGIGHAFRGLLGVSACFFRRTEADDGTRDLDDVHVLADEVFQVNYLEPWEEAEVRFRKWLDDVLLRGVDLWQRTS